MKDLWLQNRFHSLYQAGWNLFSKTIDFEKSSCTLFCFENKLKNKKNILFLHGLGTSWNTWANSIEQFAGKYNIYVLDMPWNCSMPCNFKTLNELVEWSLAIIKNLDIKKPIVITHSYGGIIMLNMLGKIDRSIIDKLIVCSLGWMCGRTEQEKIKLHNTFMNNFYELVYSSLSAGIRPGTDEDTIQYMCNRVMATLDQNILKEYFDLGHQTAQPFPEKLDIPVFLIAGENDFLAPKEDSILINKKLKGSKYVCIPKSKHFPMVEAKEAFNDIVHSFCNE